MSMRFIKGTPEEAATDIAKRLNALLSSGRSVLWLVSGGSNVAIQCMAMNMVPDSLSKDLVILPVDERFGPYGHKDSNSARMRHTGFNPKHAEWIDLLDQGLDLPSTVTLFNEFMAREIAIDDYIFATLGMGKDGHTAGILPHSPALESTDFAIAYKADDYERITICADALVAHTDEIIVSAFGRSKAAALRQLRDKSETRQIIPAVILHQVENCTVYNNIVEGTY